MIGSTISFAQNAEDVVLNRAFTSIDDGFYVDVGALHPEFDSVTKLFYDRGWSGINVEPQRAAFNELQAARPRDTNLNVAIGTATSALTFYEALDAPGLSTFEPQLADHARTISRVVTRSVPILSLGDILHSHARGREIAFLKIDVEGREYDVLESGDWNHFRPQALVIEGDDPRVATFLQERHYFRTMWDGLNTFWVREEDRDRLFEPLSRPAVIAIDGFHPWPFVLLIRDAVEALLASHVETEGAKADLAALGAVALAYAHRPDLRHAFGNPLTLDFDGLLRWAADASPADDPEAAAFDAHRRYLRSLPAATASNRIRRHARRWNKRLRLYARRWLKHFRQ